MEKYQKKLESYSLEMLLKEYDAVRGTTFEKKVFSILQKRIDKEIYGGSDELISLYRLLRLRRAEKFFKDRTRYLEEKILYVLHDEFAGFEDRCSSAMEAKNKMDELFEFFPYGVYKILMRNYLNKS